MCFFNVVNQVLELVRIVPQAALRKMRPETRLHVLDPKLPLEINQLLFCQRLLYAQVDRPKRTLYVKHFFELVH